MTCREAIEFLMSYLDGELPAEVQAEFERHLAACRSCVAYIDTYKTTVKLEKAALCDGGSPALPPLPEELVQAIVAAHSAGK
jgi:anti-sigma factor RsiW